MLLPKKTILHIVYNFSKTIAKYAFLVDNISIVSPLKSFVTNIDMSAPNKLYVSFVCPEHA
jgi:hypothetical protein